MIDGGIGAGAATGVELDEPIGDGVAGYTGATGGAGQGFAPAGPNPGSVMTGEPAGTFRDQAERLRGQAGDKLRAVADEGKAQVANSLEGLVTAARDIADKLADGQFGPVAGYARTVADTLDGWSATVRDKPVEEWVDDGRELIRRSPAVAVGVAVAAGFVLSRFLKASAQPGGSRFNA